MGKMDGAPRRPVVLIILDGFGANPSKAHNAIALADTPNFDDYFARYPHTLIGASGRACGLPDGQMGNSEVGHITLGSGCLIRQDLVKIDDAIADESFYENKALCNAMDKAAAADGKIHLIGLVSDGGVHSHINHLFALLRLARRKGVQPILHMITDGRDTAPQAAVGYLSAVEMALLEANGKVATVCGRYHAMDRDNRWHRTELAWRVIAKAEGHQAPSLEAAIAQAYEHNAFDEFVPPTAINGGEPLQPESSVIFFNFRKDRPRQLTAALFKQDFDEFERPDYTPVEVTCFTEYDKWYQLPFAFKADKPKITLGKYLAEQNLRQFHCAETEKFAHVTYFFNGGTSEPFPGEDRVIVPSPDVGTYDLMPEMSAKEVANQVIEAIKSRNYAFIVVNFANGDMVGHTAVRSAVIQAVETLDREVGRVLDTAVEHKYSVILTADHGNCDEMVDPVTGEPHTQHTVYPVPCLVIDKHAWKLTTSGELQNIAPTVLQLMGLNRPENMKARSLLLV